MRYELQYQRNPADDLGDRLVDYLADDGMLVGPSGLDSGTHEQQGFAEFVGKQEMTRLHTITFEEDYPTEQIQEGIHEVAKDHFDGEWMIGVHDSNPKNNHAHVGHAGSEDQLWLTGDDIRKIRRDIVSHFDGETRE